MQHALSYPTRPAVAVTPWLAVFARLGLFTLIQAGLAAALWLAGRTESWEAAAAWWPIGIVLANGICVLALVRVFRGEGGSFWSLFRIERANVKSDLLAMLAVLAIVGPLGVFPNLLLARWLFDDPEVVLPFLIRPLPLWAAWVSVIAFPVTQGLAELSTYFGYAMPRLQSQGLRPWQAIALPALMLGLQHIALPLVFDWRYLVWRGLMFVPFALGVGVTLHWRPRLLPYTAAVHVLMDVSFAAMLLEVAY
jgi:hypothetical protein